MILTNNRKWQNLKRKQNKGLRIKPKNKQKNIDKES